MHFVIWTERYFFVTSISILNFSIKAYLKSWINFSNDFQGTGSLYLFFFFSWYSRIVGEGVQGKLSEELQENIKIVICGNQVVVQSSEFRSWTRRNKRDERKEVIGQRERERTEEKGSRNKYKGRLTSLIRTLTKKKCTYDLVTVNNDNDDKNNNKMFTSND